MLYVYDTQLWCIVLILIYIYSRGGLPVPVFISLCLDDPMMNVYLLQLHPKNWQTSPTDNGKSYYYILIITMFIV